MAVIEFIAGKAGGLLISSGLLITASWWAVNTYVRKVDGAKDKKDVQIARILMYVFFVLMLIKVFLGPKISVMATRKLVAMEQGAKQMVTAVAKAKSPVGQSLIKSRKFFSNKFVTGGLTAGMMGSVFLLETGKKEGDEARQMPIALGLVIVSIMALYGQLVKDSVAGAIGKAAQVPAVAAPK